MQAKATKNENKTSKLYIGTVTFLNQFNLNDHLKREIIIHINKQ